MAKTPDQKEAEKALAAAVEWMQKAFGSEGVPSDWIVVAADVKFDEDDDVTAGYSLFYSNGSLPHHTALGLLESGIQILNESGWKREEE